ncbi:MULTISPECIES: alpha/beta fold hydrolase [Pseudonocardia]|uniref:4,5:9,10-diseco-3-hydroxy-5,9, 17-trioxoandrosta-1(10),2-diene-4-oate hydrolase n=2 Tax=Pseudonocardia TaxID=1847 RepID=A0A1Y2MPD3_PSEAH|nr:MULTISPECIES: alpha/beta hydrolase [Pseudonocardia]OSY36849.1 4,5:9,10-diseco-3-hydroxy-5,9,17-trioxoandrosta-1(10),2-diene-4-oate hydrolase [Pseudonocardia autotrophica]TDN76840.1 pimeloyl-ACP methyl ester carboxylesterase [Pseudonocardia autotrophica]
MAVHTSRRIRVDDRLGVVPPRGSELRFRTVHGYRRAFRVAGSGPAVVLVHGIGDSSATWEAVLPALARRHLVIAPDLLGHGNSEKPRADYSVAAYANGIRDLLGVLGIGRATLVGHSLGGGVAMQFAYQFPERTERLVLVGTGGAGPDVTPLLRAVSMPGAQALLAALQLPPVRWQAGLMIDALRLLGTDLGRDADDLLRVIDALPDATARAAFIRTLRAVVDWRGQVVTMLDRCYLTRGMPTMLVWGERDAVVPVEHAYTAHRAMPGSRLEIFGDTGHFPFHSDPARFVGLLEEFLSSTEPARWSPEQWRQLLRCPGPAPSGTRPGPVSAT